MSRHVAGQLAGGAGRSWRNDPFAEAGLVDLPPVDLKTVLAAAELQVRVDRKYVVPVPAVRQLTSRLRASHQVLSIGGRRATTYGTIYFDTPDRRSFRDHVQGRRLRWKIRTRLYREDQLCRLEIKKDDGGTTVKQALTVPATAYGRLTPQGRDFVADGVPALADAASLDLLEPTVSIDYSRATLCDLAEGTRLTLDASLQAAVRGRLAWLRPGHVLVESKGGHRLSRADRVLLDLGIRPVSVSKYSLSLSLLESGLAGNPWRRVARDYFAVTRAGRHT